MNEAQEPHGDTPPEEEPGEEGLSAEMPRGSRREELLKKITEEIRRLDYNKAAIAEQLGIVEFEQEDQFIEAFQSAIDQIAAAAELNDEALKKPDGRDFNDRVEKFDQLKNQIISQNPQFALAVDLAFTLFINKNTSHYIGTRTDLAEKIKNYLKSDQSAHEREFNREISISFREVIGRDRDSSRTVLLVNDETGLSYSKDALSPDTLESMSEILTAICESGQIKPLQLLNKLRANRENDQFKESLKTAVEKEDGDAVKDLILAPDEQNY